MPKVEIWAELSEERLRDYTSEAKRLGVKVERLIEQTVKVLLEELEQDLKDCADIPITPS
jgi:hypothetical protein